MNPAEILAVLEDRGAVRRGHFRLSSGRHSDVFVQKFRDFEDPRPTQRFGEAISDMFASGLDFVASPAGGATVLGFSPWLAADKRSIFAERVDGKMTFRRGFELASRERTLVVEDVITTGGSARELVDLVQERGASAVGVGALLDRSDPTRRFDAGVPLKALTTIQATSWDQTECPLCDDDVPLDDPGSRRI